LWKPRLPFATFPGKMLRLDRVEISGFKSFYEKVDLAFPGSVTAVVGPNGCGKSNICDAVAWALGEQSARLLRGERMDDVIFNGSAKRRPLGMAEVFLTLSPRGGNGNGTSKLEPMRIGRRVYREGLGEYFLNDKQVRLKDIQDELLGTGLGVRTYSVIEQGRIDQVLSTKPQDRRRLIEEAAGITKYKLKKRLAEAKLEETKANLLRLSDIISEIERNCASLKRQASRAARYKERSEALRSRRASLARARCDRLSEAREGARRLREERKDREAQAAAASGRAEAELARARLAAAEALAERNRLRETVANLEAAIERDGALSESSRRAAADLALRRETLEKEARELAAEEKRAAVELEELSERIERAVADARARSIAREEADRRASEAAGAFTRLEADLEAARAEALSAAGEGVSFRNARHEVDLEASRVAASLERLQTDLEKSAQELSLREEETAKAEEERARLAAEAHTAFLELSGSEKEITRLDAAIADAEKAREEAHESLSALEHRAAALTEMLRGREEIAQDGRRALGAAGFTESGSLGEKLTPVPGWEDAVDLLLGEDSHALLASDNAIEVLAAKADLSASRMVRADWKERRRTAAIPGALGGWEVALANHDGLGTAELAALPPVSFVESLSRALEMGQREPAVTFVTRRGESVRGSLVRLGKPRPEAGGLFALSRQRRELEEGRAARGESLAAAEEKLQALRLARQQHETDFRARRAREREAASALSAFLGRFEERLAERDRSRRERETLEEETKALSAEMMALDRRRRELEGEERRQAEREEALRKKTDLLAAKLPEARALAMSASEELAHRRTEAEVAAERRRSLEAAREKLLESGKALARRAAEATEQDRLLSARSEELAAEEKEARERQTANLRARNEKAAELEAAAAAAEEEAARAARAEETARGERAALDQARESRFEAEMAEARAGADFEHLLAQAKEEFGVEPGELAPPEDTSEEALTALEAEAVEIASALERLGPVNLLAYEEHRQEAERLSFLTVQRDDLLKSISELQDSIRKINAISSERFAEAFAGINANFKEMFTRLFSGGTAEMRLLDENDLLESGVEVVAQPPGKRNQSILLLSGGEKALTAIALLMAIFRYKPSPFCILDEVDAPLDEANIDRFTRLLREMTEETQFIAITHNKRTMETADVMYGVTMEEPGCSKIVSVKFD